jgi:hypothetical protein
MMNVIKLRLAIFVFAVLYVTGCNAQDECEPVSLGKQINEINGLNFSENGESRVRRFSHFDFESFSGGGVVTDSTDYYEVGFDSKSQIKTITRKNSKFSILNYRFVVFQFEDHRILIVKRLKEGKYVFTSLAILIFHRNLSADIFLLNISPVFGENHGVYHFENYENFPPVKLEKVSAIMELDGRLYPQKHLRLSNGYVALAGTVVYAPDKRTIKYDLVSFVFERNVHPEAKISEGTCLGKVFDAIDTGDFVVALHPKTYGLDKEPIWIFGGGHEYRE